jgi:ABC-type sugar transport system ATPase subunit
MPSPPLLSLRDVSKSFGSVQALRDVSITWERGRIYGLAGENGAGKSTLNKILAGVHTKFDGRIECDGAAYSPQTPGDAVAAGISVFHQEIPVCPNLSVTANVFLAPHLPGSRFFPDWRQLESRCRQLFKDLLALEMDTRRLMRDCTVAERQLALLVRVLSRRARLIILDEPTTALTRPEVLNLFVVIRRLRAQGITFIFVSHLLDELIELCDEIHVLRDGELVAHLRREQFDTAHLTRLIAGRTLPPPASVQATSPLRPRLEVRALSRSGHFRDVSFCLGAGEILGITGLQGSGRSAVARALCGSPPAQSGEVWLNGRKLQLRHPRDAVAAGIGYVPEDRKSLGLFEHLDVKTNLAMARLDGLAKAGWLPRPALAELAYEMQRKLQIKMSSADAPVTSLSGGNQQKVLIGRCLAIHPQVLVMNEPTRGVDVGAKDEICQRLRQLAGDGCSVIVASSDLEELLRLSDRILVMRAGRIAAEFLRSVATKEKLIHAASVADPTAAFALG